MDCVERFPYTGSSSRQTIDAYVCNGLINIEPGGLICNKLYFLTNPALISETMMIVFALDAISVHAAFHSSRTLGVMMWGVISYHGLFQLLRIEENLNSNRYVRKVLEPEVVSILRGIPGAILQQDNACIILSTCCKKCPTLPFSPKYATYSLAFLFAGYVTY
ncbi:uncharacterized protein TNCV_450901 [Trichonephila clavipes]|nr:uncharacterized protein TNCV_450901 [Trichonephila clavipes]